MQFFLFVVAIAFVVGVIGISAWAFARSFVYLCHQTHRGIVFAVNRVFVPASRCLSETVMNAKAMCVANVQSTARSEEAVIEQPASAFESVKTEEAEPAPIQTPKGAESEVDWAVYDIPTFLRKGKVLVW